MDIRFVKLTAEDLALARATFATMVAVFEEERTPLDDDYLARLLARDSFIAFAAVVEGSPIGGITAHVLPMTRTESSELFIYDLAVVAEHQRKGIGRRLVAELRADAAKQGIDEAFVPADDEDTHALDFYRALGGTPAPVTMFTFSGKASS